MRRGPVVLLLAVLLATPIFAQDPPDRQAQLAAEEKRLENYAKSETDEQKRWAAAIGDRIALLKELIRTEQETASLIGAEEIEALAKSVEVEIAREQARAKPTRPALESADGVSAYETGFGEANRRRNDARAAVAKLNERRSETAQEKKELGGREAQAKERLGSLKGDDELATYRRDTLRVELEVVAARRDFLERATAGFAPLISLRQRQLDLAELVLAWSDELLALAREVEAELRGKAEEANREKARLEAEAASAEDDPITKFLRLRGAEKSTARSRTEAVASRATTLRDAISNRKEVIERVRRERGHLEKRIAYDDPGVADLLGHAHERSTKAIQNLRQNVAPRLANDTALTQKEYLKVLDRLWELQLPAEDNPVLRELEESLPGERRPEAKPALAKVLDGKDGLLAALRDLQTALEGQEALQGELAALLAESLDEHRRQLDFARANLVFSQTSPPISGRTFLRAAREVPGLVGTYTNPLLWAEASEDVGNLTRGGLLLLTLIVFMGAVVVIPRQLKRKKGGGSEEANRFMGYGPVLVRLVVAVTPPAGFYVTALAIERLSLPPALHQVLPVALRVAGGLLAIRRLSIWFFDDRGMGIHRVGIIPENAVRLRRIIGLATLIGLFFAVPAAALEQLGEPVENLVRVLDALWIVALGFSMIALFSRRGPILRQITRPGRLLHRLWMVVGPLLALGIMALILLEFGGYRVAAWTFLRNFVESFAMVLLVMALYSFLVRIIGTIAKQVRKRMILEEGYEAAQASFDKVSDQLTRLAAIVIVIVAMVFLLNSWNDHLVLLDYLGGVKLIETDPGEYLTLLRVFEAIGLIAAAHFIVANLSALYEFVVFPLLGSTNRGGQYVLLALSRYVILLLAYGIALLLLGLRMSNIAWLFAAASVGIGFGLQEIIANFVSGLIILLERPIQVGDIITVDGTEGTVEKISIRSTIVTNWDRQSIIIPNKDFITKKLTNWTRNDDIMRRRIDLRVAFGSSIPEVIRIVDETIRAHPKVLRDPPHRIWMSAYEESGPAFMIFVFTRISDGLDTRAQLYQRFYENLADHGIEIPVPTRKISVMHEPDPMTGPVDAEGEPEA